MDDYDRLLTALRRIIRVTDLNAKKLAKETGLTPPQFLILQALDGAGALSIGAIATEINLSQATVTSIVDRMEARGVVTRRRNEKDRRVVNVDLTTEGRDLLDQAPKLLQDRLQDRFNGLKDWEKGFLISALDRMSDLLGAEEVDAAPILDVGSMDRPME